MPDLDRTTGTIYGLRNARTGRIRRVDYMDAFLAWKGGEVVYTKNGTGYRGDVHARPWNEHPPRT